MQQRVPYGFSILLLVADVVRIFGEKRNISHIAVVP